MNPELLGFIDESNLAGFDVAAIPGDVSNRKYYRLTNGQESRILMDDSSSESGAMKAFVHVRDYLAQNGYSVPGILGQDFDKRYMVLEDLGKETIGEHLTSTPKDIPEIYHAIIDLLISFNGLTNADLPEFDNQFFIRELSAFIDWYLPYIGKPINETGKESFISSWDEPLNYLSMNDRNVHLVHKDLHCGNLFWLPSRGTIRNIGIIDFQSAKRGSSSYDVTSLLYDCRFPLDPILRETLLGKYRNALGLQSENFRNTCAIFIAQRNIKILGNFARVYKQNGNEKYLRFLPNVWRYINDIIDNPLLGEVNEWMMERGIRPAN